jgi:hypothetical protein
MVADNVKSVDGKSDTRGKRIANNRNEIEMCCAAAFPPASSFIRLHSSLSLARGGATGIDYRPRAGGLAREIVVPPFPNTGASENLAPISTYMGTRTTSHSRALWKN